MSGIKTEYKHNHSGINKTKHKGMLYQLLMLGEKENCDWIFTCKYYKCGWLTKHEKQQKIEQISFQWGQFRISPTDILKVLH